MQSKIYNVILGLARHLGFDPVFFQPIDDTSFVMDKDLRAIYKSLGRKQIKFVRHHFRNNPDVNSILLEDQVLIDLSTHSFWGNAISEDATLQVVKVLEALSRYTVAIGTTDIEREFRRHVSTENQWIMQFWLDGDLTDKLSEFNKRKNDMQTTTLDEWFDRNYPLTYGKWYNTLLKQKRVLVINIIQDLHPKIDVTSLINLGENDDHIGPFTWVFAEILRSMHYNVRAF